MCIFKLFFDILKINYNQFFSQKKFISNGVIWCDFYKHTLLRAATSAPRARRNSTISNEPWRQACMSGVFPLWIRELPHLESSSFNTIISIGAEGIFKIPPLPHYQGLQRRHRKLLKHGQPPPHSRDRLHEPQSCQPGGGGSALLPKLVDKTTP